jgi:DNA-binding LacI/PurR family transcriptional regulator
VVLTKGPIRLADIAKAAGVSQGTASNVFSRPEIVREEVRERVLGIARDLGYKGPDVKGRLLRAGKFNAIGVASLEPLSYFFDDPWARAMMKAVSDVCDETGTGIALVSARNQQKLAWNINSALVDGFILLCVKEGGRLVDLSRQRQVPCVALALENAEDGFPIIEIDNRKGAEAAARHLAELGHKNFAVLAITHCSAVPGTVKPETVASAMSSSARLRIEGYFDALRDFDINPQDVAIHATLNDKKSVINAVEALFSAPEPPTALLAMSDRIALYAIQWLTERGISVPNDVSIIGFDGVPEAALSTPALTTMQQPFEDIAAKAVSAILNDEELASSQILDVKLVLRNSTAPPRSFSASLI